MTSVCAHIAGLPVEESVAQLAPAGVAVVVVALHLARERTRRSTRRLGRLTARLRRRSPA